MSASNPKKNNPTSNLAYSDQVIALAGIFHFATLVERLAKTGAINSENLQLSVQALFSQNPKNTLDVFGGNLSSLIEGFESLLAALKREVSAGNVVMRYVSGIIHLQKRLAKQKDMLNVIAKHLEKCKQQSEHFSPTHDNVIANLADAYTSTVSTLQFRIQVLGNHQYLQQNRIANQIRTVLFAGIRSAVLWRQLGGRRLGIIFKRGELIRTTEALLKQAKSST